MAKNIVRDMAESFSAVVSDPVTPVSGDPVIVGQIPGVALTAKRADNTTTVARVGTATLSVKGVTTAAANSAVAVGDILYYLPAHTPKISKAFVHTAPLPY